MTEILKNIVSYLNMLYDFPFCEAAVIMAAVAFLYFFGCLAVPGLKKKVTKPVIVSGLLFSFYVSQVIGITILNRTMTEEARYDLNLFDVYRIALNGNSVFLTQLIGNVLMFVPLGILTPICFQRMRTFIRMFFCAFLCSLGIEMTQLCTHTGLFELVDLLNNTLGGAVGYVIFKAGYVVYWFRKRRI